MEDYLIMLMSKGMEKVDIMKKLEEIRGSKSVYTEHHAVSGGHFDTAHANKVVSEMYHYEDGKKYMGEKFDRAKATEVMHKYKELLPEGTTLCDVYVAINAQYHDYSTLFKSWYREGIEHKIIESAIIFWFCDVDYEGDSKVHDYFHMMH